MFACSPMHSVVYCGLLIFHFYTKQILQTPVVPTPIIFDHFKEIRSQTAIFSASGNPSSGPPSQPGRGGDEWLAAYAARTD